MFAVLPASCANKSTITHMIPTDKTPILYLYTKFQADRSIRSKVIRKSQNFEIWSRDPSHAHLKGHFVVHTQLTSTSISVQIWSG